MVTENCWKLEFMKRMHKHWLKRRPRLVSSVVEFLFVVERLIGLVWFPLHLTNCSLPSWEWRVLPSKWMLSMWSRSSSMWRSILPLVHIPSSWGSSWQRTSLTLIPTLDKLTRYWDTRVEEIILSSSRIWKLFQCVLWKLFVGHLQRGVDWCSSLLGVSERSEGPG